MRMMQDEWEEYFTKCFPVKPGDSVPVDEVQYREMHQAFFAGALAFSTLVEKTAVEETEDDAIKKLSRLRRELITVCSFFRAALKGGKCEKN